MELDNAIHALKQAASKHKQEDVEAAIDELNSVPHLLKLSSGDKVHSSLEDIFIHKMPPLFEAVPAQMLDFCALVVETLFQQKIRPARDANMQFSWETAMRHVVYSAVDFLEYKPSQANKSAAKRLFSVLCDMCYPNEASYEWRSTSLIFNVNILLETVATDHQENQRLLRDDKVLGAKRLGYALSRSRDYFVLDSILNLVAPLLPTRDVPAKRTQFLDALFPPDLFPRNADIKRFIEVSKGIHWDPVVTQIINSCLAKTDISFPQPFYIIGLRTTGTKLPNFVPPMYVDNKGFYANIDQDDTVESYQVPYTSMERIKLSAPGPANMQVTLHLTSSPLLGSCTTPEHVKCTLSFHVDHTEAAHFVEALKARGLEGKINQREHKVSMLAEGNLSFEFDATGYGNGGKPATQQEKVAKVQQLWQSQSNDVNDRGLCEPTSPLVRSDSAQEALYGSDLSDIEGAPSKSKPKLKSSAPRVRVRIAPHSSEADDEDDEDGPHSPAARSSVPRKSAMRRMKGYVIIDSEDEEEESPAPTNAGPVDLDFEPTQEEPARVPSGRVTRGAAAAKKDLKEKESAPAASIRRARDTPDKAAPVDRGLQQLSEDEMDVVEKPVDKPKAAKWGGETEKGGKKTGKKNDVRDGPTPARITRGAAARGARTENKARSENASSGAPLELQQLSEDDIELELDPPSGFAEAAKSAQGKGETARAKASKSKRSKRPRTEDDEGAEDNQDEQDEEDFDRPVTKRLRATLPPSPPAAPRRRISAMVFGTQPHSAPAKKRYGGKKGRTSSPTASADVDDADMDVDFDEVPAAQSHLPPAPLAEKKKKEAAKQNVQEPEAPKSRVAGMKGKAGQKPATAAKAPPKAKTRPKAKAAPADKKKKTQTADDGETQAVENQGNADVELSDGEDKPPRRSTRATKLAEPIVNAAITQVKPKPKSEKPRKAPWEDMHLRKNAEDVATSEVSNMLEEYEVPLKGSNSSDPPFDPPFPQDEVTMIDVEQADALPKVDKILQAENELAETHTVNPTSLPPAVAPNNARPVHILPAVSPAVDSPLSCPVSPSKPFKIDALASKHTSPVVVTETRAPPLAVAKSKLELAAPPFRASLLRKITPSDPVPPTPPRKQSTPARPVRPKETAVLRPAPSPDRRAAFSPAQESPVTEPSIFHSRTVALVPPPASPSPSVAARRDIFNPSRKVANNRAHAGSPRRSRQGLFRGREKSVDDDYEEVMGPIYERLDELNDFILHKKWQYVKEVKRDVRVGANMILREAGAGLKAMSKDYEDHFNKLVDLEDDSSNLHRNLLLGIDDMQKSAESMAHTLAQIVQHHDRYSLSKKLPTTLVTLPANVRNPVLSF